MISSSVVVTYIDGTSDTFYDVECQHDDFTHTWVMDMATGVVVINGDQIRKIWRGITID